MEIAEVAIRKELTHVNCGSETTRCQAKTRREAEEVPILPGRNVSALGAGQ
jgi:hypothetical protein